MSRPEVACSGKSENLEALQIRLCWDIQKLSINPRRSSFVTNFTVRLSLNSFLVSDTPSRRRPHLGSSTCALLSTNLPTHLSHSLPRPAHLQCKVARPLRLPTSHGQSFWNCNNHKKKIEGRLDYYDNLSSLYAAPLFLSLSFHPYKHNIIRQRGTSRPRFSLLGHVTNQNPSIPGTLSHLAPETSYHTSIFSPSRTEHLIIDQPLL